MVLLAFLVDKTNVDHGVRKVVVGPEVLILDAENGADVDPVRGVIFEINDENHEAAVL